MTTYDMTEFDLFFISYDEPNAEKHWALLSEMAPWAQRSHGIKGFDNAHRACANKSETDWFITIDADNIVRPSFFDSKIEFNKEKEPLRCFSWNGKNVINGLCYGNGGIKLWSKKFVLNMNSHENSTDPRKAVDFCWEDEYKQKSEVYSDVWNNGSPYQAFRVGFREGVKLTLDRGNRVIPELMKTKLHHVNLRNIKIWSSVGSDIENGLWAIYGARLGWWNMCNMEWDHTSIRDYEWFNRLWNTITEKTNLSIDVITNHAIELGEQIQKITKINIPLLNEKESLFFKEVL